MRRPMRTSKARARARRTAQPSVERRDGVFAGVEVMAYSGGADGMDVAALERSYVCSIVGLGCARVVFSIDNNSAQA